MSRSYRKGYSLELAAKRLLEEEGAKVIRFAGSKPIDLFFKVGSRMFAAECKNVTSNETRIYIPEDEVKKLEEIAEFFGAEPVIIFSFRKQRPRVAFIQDLARARRSLRIEKGEGIPLREFVRRVRARSLEEFTS